MLGISIQCQGFSWWWVWIKWRFLWPRFSPSPRGLAHCTGVGNMLLLTLYKELCPVLWATQRHSRREAETGVVAAPRTETNDGCGLERPRGRDRLAACRLDPSGRDFSTLPATMGIKLGITLSPQKCPIIIPRSHWIHSELARGWNPLVRQWWRASPGRNPWLWSNATELYVKKAWCHGARKRMLAKVWEPVWRWVWKSWHRCRKLVLFI